MTVSEEVEIPWRRLSVRMLAVHPVREVLRARFGMQELVLAIRVTGATNIIILTGNKWGSQLDQWLQYRPIDPLNQLAAGWHSYGDGFACQDEACWNSTLKTVCNELCPQSNSTISVAMMGTYSTFAQLTAPGRGRCAPRPRSSLRSQARCALTSGATPRVRAEPPFVPVNARTVGAQAPPTRMRCTTQT